jgi:hypothetical protein
MVVDGTVVWCGSSGDWALPVFVGGGKRGDLLFKQWVFSLWWKWRIGVCVVLVVVCLCPGVVWWVCFLMKIMW